MALELVGDQLQNGRVDLVASGAEFLAGRRVCVFNPVTPWAAMFGPASVTLACSPEAHNGSEGYGYWIFLELIATQI